MQAGVGRKPAWKSCPRVTEQPHYCLIEKTPIWEAGCTDSSPGFARLQEGNEINQGISKNEALFHVAANTTDDSKSGAQVRMR